MLGKSFRLKSLRLYPREDSIINRACAALNGMERSQLVQEAAQPLDPRVRFLDRPDARRRVRRRWLGAHVPAHASSHAYDVGTRIYARHNGRVTGRRPEGGPGTCANR